MVKQQWKKIKSKKICEVKKSDNFTENSQSSLDPLFALGIL